MFNPKQSFLISLFFMNWLELPMHMATCQTYNIYDNWGLLCKYVDVYVYVEHVRFNIHNVNVYIY